MRVAWTPRAEESAAAVVESMRGDRTGAAWRWLQGMLAKVRALAKDPRHAFVVRELARSANGGVYGEVYVEPCRIIFRIDLTRIAILTLRPVGRHKKSARYEERPRGARPAARDRS